MRLLLSNSGGLHELRKAFMPNIEANIQYTVALGSLLVL